MQPKKMVWCGCQGWDVGVTVADPGSLPHQRATERRRRFTSLACLSLAQRTPFTPVRRALPAPHASGAQPLVLSGPVVLAQMGSGFEMSTWTPTHSCTTAATSFRVPATRCITM